MDLAEEVLRDKNIFTDQVSIIAETCLHVYENNATGTLFKKK